MKTNMRFLMAACLVMGLACGGGVPTNPGGGGGVTPLPVEVLTVSVSVPSVSVPDTLTYPEALIKFTVEASSNKGDVSKKCTVDGVAIGCDSFKKPAGTYQICAEGKSPTGLTKTECTQTTVNVPKFQGRVVSATAIGEYIPIGAYVIFEGKDSARVDSEGKVSLDSKYSAMLSALVEIRGDKNLLPYSRKLSSNSFGSFVLVADPNSIKIPSGGYAGQVININLVLAQTPSPPPSAFPFFYKSAAGRGYEIGGWKSFPQCVGFMGMSSTGSNEAITTSDSVSFWTHLDSLEKVFGMDLVKPCTESETKTKGGIEVSLKVGQPTNSGAANVSSSGEHLKGVMTMNSHISFNKLFPIHHEFFHAFFGVGHTCAWDSISRSSCPRGMPDQISATDVAYVTWKQRVWETERKYGVQ